MEYIIMAAAAIALVAWFFVSVLICIYGFEVFCDSWSGGGIILLVGAVSFIGCFATMFYFIDSHDDNSEHCGPGTEYRESLHYNPSTRSTDTDWWCEVK